MPALLADILFSHFEISYCDNKEIWRIQVIFRGEVYTNGLPSQTLRQVCASRILCVDRKIPEGQWFPRLVRILIIIKIYISHKVDGLT